MNIPYPKTVQWALIPGCDGYEACKAGLIRRTKTGRIVRQSQARNGVPKVNIGHSTRTVRDLVARAFFGHPLIRGYRVINANGDLTDNRLDNLVWSGSTVLNSQPPVLPHEFEREYDQVRDERLALMDLMQN